jgi:hypothetical protein
MDRLKLAESKVGGRVRGMGLLLLAVVVVSAVACTGEIGESPAGLSGERGDAGGATTLADPGDLGAGLPPAVADAAGRADPTGASDTDALTRGGQDAGALVDATGAPAPDDAPGATPGATPDDAPSAAGPNADPPEPAVDWACEQSDYRGTQYWTCSEGSIYRCDAAGRPVRTACADGCRPGPLATDDRCSDPSTLPIPLPALQLVIHDGLFAESAVRGPLEEGLAYAVERMFSRLDIAADRRLPEVLTLEYSASGNSYCSGQAFASSAGISCPYGYPIEGDNQNFVVNLSIHELGHILALHLITDASVRTTCTNEGLASWIAARYWMNHHSRPVGSLREAARGAIADGTPASMRNCVSASDPYYKIYASFFEYLDQNVPGGVLEVARGRSALDFEADWLAWLR